MSDPSSDGPSRTDADPVTGHPEDLPDAFGEDPDDKKPLVESNSIDPDDDLDAD